MSVLIACAVILGGAWDRGACAMPPMQPMAMSGMPCAMVGVSHARSADPCASQSAPCCKQMAPAGFGLPTRPADAAPAIRVAAITWIVAPVALSGLAREPETLPPRTV